jgi:excinuclease ABC subunit A
LYAAICNELKGEQNATLPYSQLLGTHEIEDCILVDQSPVSRSPRSNPVTYVKAFDEIRHVFAETADAKARNLTASHFSFNSELGRCQVCEGDGSLQIDMQFLADVTMTCPACHGDRYRAEILTTRFRDRTITDVLKMTVSEAQQFFRGSPKVQQKLKVLVDVGLEYLRLGQPATTLSAGESQRLKLASYLAAASRRKTLFILDEPTTGLHTHDITKLIDCFEALIEYGHSLLVVEHNLHLIAAADHVIDLGPGPSNLGGNVVATGTPEAVAAHPGSITGQFLRTHL